jgi:uncharacterized protein YjiS (DUF1127 family)
MTATDHIATYGTTRGARPSLRRRLRHIITVRNAAQALIDRLLAALAACEAERRRCEMIRELHLLDDRMLVDIGLKRDEIESTVRGETPPRP